MSNPSFEDNVSSPELPEVPAEHEDENPDDLVGEPVEDDGMPDEDAEAADNEA